MTHPTDTPNIVYVKYETTDGELQIARHMRPALLDPTDELADFIREIVHSYKSNPEITYLGLADDDEYKAFNSLHFPATDRLVKAPER